MTLWDQDNYQTAWRFAATIHQGQTLPGSDIPYLHHLGLVAMEACAAVAQDAVANPDRLVLCALLHDAIEDTDTPYDEIQARFGRDIADGVQALSKNPQLPTKREQMQDSLHRIRQQPREVWMVKLCDRITNLQAPPAHWDQTKIAAYQDEARLILRELGEASPFLAARLAEKIAGYDQYLSS